MTEIPARDLESGPTTMSIKSYPCPQCKKMVVWSSALFKPFCSERCKMIDFGAWAAEEHIIPGSLQDENYDNF